MDTRRTDASSEDILLGRAAVELGLLNPEQVRDALREQAELLSGGRRLSLGSLLVERGRLKTDDLLRLLKEQGRLAQGLPRLERYEIRDRLGEGSTAAVYRAWDLQLKRTVALKIFRASPAPEDPARLRFRREAETAAGLAHPNLVAVHDAGEADGRMYIVMEFVEGRSLALLLADRPVDRRNGVRLLEQAARGVAAAHEKGVIHRDLKPANILVSASGEVKVADFGLARLMDPTAGLTATGDSLGTPLYMAPEQAAGRTRDIGPASDVYALGAVLYEILAGRPPHTASTVPELFRRIAEEAPAPPGRGDTDLEAVALKALSRNPADRYPSAGPFADDLARVIEGKRPLARARPARRLSLAAAVLAAAVLAAAALAAGLWAWLRPPAPIPGLEGRWSLDGPSPAAENVGRTPPGRLLGAPEARGGALRFRGGPDCLELPNTPALDRLQAGDYSLSAWFRPDALPSPKLSDTDAAFAILVKPGKHIGLSYEGSGRFVMAHWAGGDYRGATSLRDGFAPGRDYHVAGVVDRAGGSTRLYVDGVEEALVRWTPGAEASDYARSPWRIGGALTGAAQFAWPAKGVIDDVRLYSRALSAAEVQALQREGN